MHRVLVYTTDLLFYSQVRGTVQPAGWTPVHLRAPELPADGVDGDTLVIDATRNLDDAWRLLDAAKPACPWLIVVAYQHLHPEVAEEAVRRGATEAVRRGAILSRLSQRLGGATGEGAPFVGAPPS